MYLKLLIGCICLVFFAFSLEADAQACGRYYINVSVLDETDKPVNNADIVLKPVDKDETNGANFARDTKNPSMFSLPLSEGQTFEFFHKIKVTAPGYNAAEIKAKFLSCAGRGVIVKLTKAGSQATAVWSFKNTVEDEATATDDKYIEGIKLTVIDAKNKSQNVEVQKWFAFVDLP